MARLFSASWVCAVCVEVQLPPHRTCLRALKEKVLIGPKAAGPLSVTPVYMFTRGGGGLGESSPYRARVVVHSAHEGPGIRRLSTEGSSGEVEARVLLLGKMLYGNAVSVSDPPVRLCTLAVGMALLWS